MIQRIVGWKHTQNPLIDTRCELRERLAAAVTALRYANQTLRFDFSKILAILFRAILQTIT
jgi:hypothetical protein